MADPLYFYHTSYGIDPYVAIPGKEYDDAAGTVPAVDGAFGGGAQVTQENLLISMWTVTETAPSSINPPSSPIPLGGALLKPTYAGVFKDSGDVAKPFFNSRYAARFSLGNIVAGGKDPQAFTYIGEWGVTALPSGVMAILNPPPELKQRLASAVRDLVSAPDPSASEFPTLGPFLTALNFDVEFKRGLGSVPVAQNLRYNAGGSYRLGHPIVPALPLARTNGADGNYPVIFDLYDTAASEEMYQRVAEQGEYYIPFWFYGDDVPSDTTFIDVTIRWVHSTARA